MTLIALDKLHPDRRNANVCPPDVAEKIRRHIERTGICPALLVRPHPKKKGHHLIVDGHHRWQIIKALGWNEVECQIVAVNRKEAGLLLLTLNRLRGTDIPRKRAELMESLLDQLTVDELTLLLPESSGEIEGLLALVKQDDEALEKALKAQIEAEQKTLPVPFGFMVTAEDAPLVRQALASYQARRQAHQGQALVAICRDVLALKEGDDGA